MQAEGLHVGLRMSDVPAAELHCPCGSYLIRVYFRLGSCIGSSLGFFLGSLRGVCSGWKPLRGPYVLRAYWSATVLVPQGVVRNCETSGRPLVASSFMRRCKGGNGREGRAHPRTGAAPKEPTRRRRTRSPKGQRASRPGGGPSSSTGTGARLPRVAPTGTEAAIAAGADAGVAGVVGASARVRDQG